MKRWLYTAVFLLICTTFGGCASLKTTEEKIRNTGYEIVEEERIPAEMKKWIEAHKDKPFQTAFSDRKYWYIAQGYGEKPCQGYEIEMDRCYETEHTISIHTLLYGPRKNKTGGPSCPYLVVRTKWKDKMIVFLNK